MLTVVAIPLTCWLCALIAAPRKPIPNHEVQELVYWRLVARHPLLLALATATTLVVVLVLVLSAVTTTCAETRS